VSPDAVHAAALDELHAKAINFTPEPEEALRAAGWQLDRYCQALPGEPPGPPLPNGSWEAAQRLMRDYEFADPSIVRAVYHPDQPLEHRDMLLEVRFYGLRFHVGVRIGGVRDETVTADGRPVRIWGWNYRTLQGHFEMGQMDYEVWKWLDAGAVEFRIRRYSRPARVANPFVRLGFRIFGRHEQVLFAKRACRRMARLVAEELGRPAAGAPVERAADSLSVGPARTGELGDRLDRQMQAP
jgi:uncharacterized protein (UPF0548 family)